MRAWIATYEGGSLLNASLKLNLTQPAITRRIQRLEDNLGVTLLNRTSKPARPTEAGINIYRDCLHIVRDADSLLLKAKNDVQPAGELRIGVSFGVMESVLGPSIDQLRQAFPDLHLNVTGGRSPDLMQMLNQHRLDAAIIVENSGQTPENVTDPISLGQELVSVVAAREEGFTDEIELEELADYSWIINPEGCKFRVQLEQALHARKLVMNVAVETWGVFFLISLVARRMGVGLTTARSVLASPYTKELQILKTRNFEPLLDVLLVRADPKSCLNPAIDALADCTRGTLAS